MRGWTGSAARLGSVVLVACGLVACGHQSPHAAKAAQSVPSRPSATSSPRSASDPASGFRSPRTHPTVALPVRLRIPAIGVDTRLVRLGLDKQGAVQTPGWQQAGWYTGSSRPGQAGPAVILGHYDTTSGPAIFFLLPSLRAGDVVQVTRADGTTIAFRVSGNQEVAKSQFPTDLVYAPTLEPSLRLVTCGGSFDTTSHHYRDNIIVSAVLS